MAKRLTISTVASNLADIYAKKQRRSKYQCCL
jgi:hypothetical protein